MPLMSCLICSRYYLGPWKSIIWLNLSISGVSFENALSALYIRSNKHDLKDSVHYPININLMQNKLDAHYSFNRWELI